MKQVARVNRDAFPQFSPDRTYTLAEIPRGRSTLLEQASAWLRRFRRRSRRLTREDFARLVRETFADPDVKRAIDNHFRDRAERRKDPRSRAVSGDHQG